MKNMKTISKLEIITKKCYGNVVFFLLRGDAPLPDITAGQFVQMRVENNPNVYLRRPISIHDVDYQNNTVSFLIQEIGEGTCSLGALAEGNAIDVVWPLGKGFTIANKGDKVLLVGGGIGMAPLLYLGKKLKENDVEPVFLLGGRSAKDLVRLEEYNGIGEVFITTNDGTFGEKGFVTQHSLWKDSSFDRCYVCGPLPMMKAVAGMAKMKNIWCEVSLENMMACGLGACLCCVENTVDGNVCVCKEGPVFNINKLLW